LWAGAAPCPQDSGKQPVSEDGVDDFFQFGWKPRIVVKYPPSGCGVEPGLELAAYRFSFRESRVVRLGLCVLQVLLPVVGGGGAARRLW
jgi:hypothetical protein